MKFKFKYIPLYLFIAINLIVIIAMNFCAYTSHMHPSVHPNWSYFGLAFPVFLLMDLMFFVFWLFVKRRIALLPIAGMLLCFSSVYSYAPINICKGVPEGTVKIMSYNVMNFGGKPMAKINYADNPIVQYILESGADIVCLQEGSVVDIAELKKVMSNEYPYIMQGAEDGCHYNACLSKYPILSAENVGIVSETNRSYAYKVMIGSDTLMVVNNHLESYRLHDEDVNDYKDLVKHPKDRGNVGRFRSLTHKLAATNAVRGHQTDRVINFIDSVGCKYIVACGDFNDSPVSYTHYRLRNALKDVYAESGCGPGISFHTNGMFFRIDHMFVNDNIETFQTKVDNSISESDHYPIISHLFLKEK